MKTFEVNFDGLVGPTHNYAGLAYGNLPSASSRYTFSSPKKAALEGLAKMRFCLSLGLIQGFIPPQERPDLKTLREAGFRGSDHKVIEAAFQKRPQLLYQCFSASSMWTANAATVSPSADTQDHRVHITTANLITQGHREIEANQTSAFLKMIFSDQRYFIHHPPLPNEDMLSDEGAANYMRLTSQHGKKGVEIFVYGKDEENSKIILPSKYPARQSRKASQTIALTHLLDDDHVIFAQQNPQAIDQGVFHNDLIAVSNENLLLYHELAFAGKPKVIKEIQEKFKDEVDVDFYFIEIQEDCLSVKDAVKSFLFNSQIITVADGFMVLIAPIDCKEQPASQVIREILTGPNPIQQVYYVDLKQSMANGGGPACLRLRCVLTEEEYKQVHPSFLLNDLKICILQQWINENFRDYLFIDDLCDHNFLKESRRALDELTQLLNLGSIYSFQKT